jgi:uncharacterized protein YcbX
MFKTFEPKNKTMIIGKIQRLRIYPVKSCAGIEVETARMTRRGLETVSPHPVKDREYMIVEAVLEVSSGHHKFITQRDRGAQKLALVTPIIRGEKLELRWQGQDAVEVPGLSTGKELPVRVHGYRVTGVDQGDEVAKMLGDYLERPVRLVRAAGSFHRKASQNYVRNENTLCYQDAYSVNWLFSESVEELGRLLGRPISYTNFRPNVVASGGVANEEHRYYHMRFGGVEGIQPKPGTRCMIPNVDPSTAAMPTSGALPLAVIFENYNWIDKSGQRQAIFAENFLPTDEGEIRVSDEVIASSERHPPLEYGRVSARAALDSLSASTTM